jgi:EAL and modified HD-GYP domain-containing signal transduction protein
MQLAATRGRFMELLAGTWKDSALSDRAFMTGIMSLMDTLLSTPLAEILAKLPVADDVRNALLERTGRLGGLLAVVEVIEARTTHSLDELLAPLPGLSVSAVEQAHLAALVWANNIGS